MELKTKNISIMNHPEKLCELNLKIKLLFQSGMCVVEVMKCITYLCSIINHNNSNLISLDSCVLEYLKMLLFW